MERDQARNRRIENAFRSRLPVTIEHAGVRHQVADIADEHQAAARQLQCASVGPGVVAVRGEPARQRLAVFLENLDQRSLAQPEPVAISSHFVRRIDRRD